MGRYYYAGGKKVAIEADETHVAVDQDRADAAGLRPLIERASAGAPRLPGGVVVTSRSNLEEKGLAKLREAGAVRPVFRHDRAMMVALPEIRVEFDDAKQREAVMASITDAPHAVEITEKGQDRLVLKLLSGSGEDALEVANFLFEHAHPASSSVRFLQFVPKPGPRR